MMEMIGISENQNKTSSKQLKLQVNCYLLAKLVLIGEFRVQSLH